MKSTLPGCSSDAVNVGLLLGILVVKGECNEIKNTASFLTKELSLVRVHDTYRHASVLKSDESSDFVFSKFHATEGIGNAGS